MKEQARFFIFIIIFSSCAHRVTPTGGAKDVKPPVVGKMEPPNYSVNFSNRKVEIKFDEYIQLNELQKQLIVSPLMDPAPVIIAKKKSVFIQLPKDLKAATTYNINFGSSIVDIHENNAIESFQYVFSTGPYLDSLYIKGKAVDAHKQTSEKGISILLYQHIADSLPLKSKPDYFARTNEKGEFKITNIGAGNYMIVALQDKNGNYKCDSPQEEAISLNKTVSPDTNEIILNYFTELASTLYIKKVFPISDKKWMIQINKPSDAVSIKPLNNIEPAYLESWSHYRDSVFIWCADTVKDTLYIQLLNNNQVVDTARIRLKTTVKIRGKGTTGSIKSNFVESNNFTNLLRPFSNPVIVFTNPIKNILRQNFKLIADSLPLNNFKVEFIDSLHRKLGIAYDWKESSRYKLTIPPGTLTDFTGAVNDTIVYAFSVMVSEELGKLQLNISNLPEGNLILQLLKEPEGIVKQQKINADGKYEFKALDPGKYRVALLSDKNDNGRWDTGNYEMKISPEQMYYFDGEITVRANWEMEQEWKVNH